VTVALNEMYGFRNTAEMFTFRPLLTFRLKRKHPIWLFDGGKVAPV
jgi:hypothetical protein